MQQFDKVLATFKPKNLGTLRPGMEEHIGWRGEFEVMWMQGDGDPQPGQWALMSRTGLDGYWVPEEDLADVVPVVGDDEA